MTRRELRRWWISFGFFLRGLTMTDWLDGKKTVITSTLMFGIMLLAIYRPGAELPDEATIGGAVQNALAAIASITWIVQLVVRAVTKKAGVLVR